MQELTLKSWEEFEDKLDELEKARENLSSTSINHVSEYIYRGQANSQWKLETTLERFAKVTTPISLADYYGFAFKAKAKVETFTERKWEILTPPDFAQWVGKQSYVSIVNMPCYEYVAYLRHHGYPSPLLDWTASPYIAAFFAFRDIPPRADNVSIYLYQEYVANLKTGSSSIPYIQTFGSYATIHQRHFLQQSSYTMCTLKNTTDYIFADHEKAGDKTLSQDQKQDLIYKFNLPVSERVKVLKRLNKMNVNSYSLFLTIDSLMEATAIQENPF